jgi:hypothetical protein
LIIAAALVTSGSALHISAQAFGTTSGSFYYPADLASGKVKTTFDMMFARVPYDVVEENQTFRWPLFSLRGLVGLPENFAVEATVSTNIVNWNFVAGPKWRYAFTDRFKAYLGADVSFFTGNLNAGQIDQSANGWSGAPGLTLGYSFGDVSLTLKGELNYVFSLSSQTGDVETDRATGFDNGWTVSGFVEQPLWGDNYIIVGLRMNHVKFYYQTWLLAPTFDKFYYVPEALLGIRL